MTILKKVYLALATGLLLTATSFAQQVKTDYDRNTNFSEYKTYSWGKIHTENPLWVPRIQDAVNSALAAKGWTEVESGGSVSIMAMEITDTHRTLNTYYNDFGGGWHWGRGLGFGESTTTEETYRVGTLVVDFLDTSSKNLIWRGSVSDILSNKSDKNIKNLDKGVAKLFSRFPPGQRNQRSSADPPSGACLSDHPSDLRVEVVKGCVIQSQHPLQDSLTLVSTNRKESLPMNTSLNSGNRRQFLSTAAGAFVASQLGLFGSTKEQTAMGSSLQSFASRSDTELPFAQLKQIDAGLLNIGYAEAGPSDGPAVILLHGWPYDIYSFVDVAPLLASSGYRVIIPYLRGYGTTRFLSSETFRNGQQSVVALDIIALMDALNIQKAVVAGFDWGARTADIMAALWPERCKAIVSVSGYLIGSQAAGTAPLPPGAEYQWWYQFYFATERGEEGYAKYRHDFSKLIWQLASPKWNFDDATFNRSAASFDNPDHVAIVIHNYRWRQNLVKGESKYDDLERKLAAAPIIKVPAITMEGDANGAPHPDPASYRAKFSGKYESRIISGGVGHNLPQEAPQAFAQAVIDVDHF